MLVSVYNQLRLAKPYGIREQRSGIFGSEDPSLWTFFSKTNMDLGIGAIDSRWSAEHHLLCRSGAG